METFTITLTFEDIPAGSPLEAAKAVAETIQESGPTTFIYEVVEESTQDVFLVDLSLDDEGAVEIVT